MTARGFSVESVRRAMYVVPWEAVVSAGPGRDTSTYVAAVWGDDPRPTWLALWGHGALLFDDPEAGGWRTGSIGHLLYDKYGDAQDHSVEVTAAQAARIGPAIGRRVPDDEQLRAAAEAEDATRRKRWALWDEFTVRRLERYARRVQRVLDAIERLPAPPRKEGDGPSDAVVVRAGESFPLVRFLAGRFRDRSRTSTGDFDVRCNRVAVVAPDGGRLEVVIGLRLTKYSHAHERAFTPFCREEAAFREDPDFPEWLAAERPLLATPAAVFPVSPTAIRVTAEQVPGRRRRLGLALMFPGRAEFVAVGDGTFRAADGRTGEIFVPDDVAVMTGVRARFLL